MAFEKRWTGSAERGSRRARLTHRATKGDGADVKILGPFFLDVRGWERRRSESLLRLVARTSSRDGEDKGGLVAGGAAARYPISAVPAAVNALARVHEIELDALVDETGVA